MNPINPIAHVSEDGRRYVAADVETTGLSPRRGDRVVEVGAVALVGHTIAEEFHSLINCGARITTASQRINGITSEMLIGQPTPDEAFPKFHAFIAGGVLAAHNAPFDVSFLRHEFGGSVWDCRTDTDARWR